MITKIKAKQLDDDVRGLVVEYGAEVFLKKTDVIDFGDIFDEIKSEGFIVRQRVPIPNGVNFLTVNISDFNFEQPPFVNYSLIAPSPSSSFYISHISNITTSNVSFYFSDTVDSAGYNLDLLLGVSTRVLYVENSQVVVSDVLNPSLKYEISVSGGSIVAIPV